MIPEFLLHYVIKPLSARFLVFTAIKIDVFWVVTPCSDVVGYQHFKGHWCFYLQGEVIEAWEVDIMK
jgi:hypothetical protein